jgi:hypothetical protein
VVAVAGISALTTWKTPSCTQSWVSSIHLLASQPSSLRSKFLILPIACFASSIFLNSFFSHLTHCSPSDLSILRVSLHVMFETVYLLIPLQFKYFSLCFISYSLYFILYSSSKFIIDCFVFVSVLCKLLFL